MSEVKRPKQPGMNDSVWVNTPLSIQQWMDDADAYIDHLEAERDDLRRENARLREALNWYANHDELYDGRLTPIVAKDALKDIKTTEAKTEEDT